MVKNRVKIHLFFTIKLGHTIDKMFFFYYVKSVSLDPFVTAVAFIDMTYYSTRHNLQKQVNPNDCTHWKIMKALHYYFISCQCQMFFGSCH